MDTKLKKSSKLAKFIITLVVLLPAIILVSLYPRMEKLMLEKQEVYQNDWDENVSMTEVWESEPVQIIEGTDNVGKKLDIREDVVNFAMEASYYLHGRLLQEAKGSGVAFEVLDEYGWINDYYTLSDVTYYYVEYHTGEQSIGESNSSLIDESMLSDFLNVSNLQYAVDSLYKQHGIIGALLLEFDAYGMLSRIEFVGINGVEYNANLYSKARGSVQQYQDNANYYLMNHPNKGIDVTEVVPKNFKAVFLLPETCMFVQDFTINLDYYVSSLRNPETIYLDIGAPIVVLICMLVVAVVALILPFVKKLNTGWEQLFCLPLEIVCGLVVAFVAGVYLMFIAMCHTTVTEIGQSVGSVEILGYTMETGSIYGLLLVTSVVGWAICFLLEYTIVAHCRQFLCGPIYYFKHRILIVRFFRWIGKQVKRLYHFIVDIDMDKGLHGTIVKVVLVNMILGIGFCCLWLVGIAGVAVYAITLYVILRTRGKQIQQQYESIMHATEQMAAGELKISLNEDLGVFAPLGAELEKVQEGFSKAVAEEAKSQSMKTELISNVSHDLKTPLTAIITYVNLLKQEGISEADRSKFIQTLDMKSQRLKVLIEDLFEVSKAQSGNIQMNFMDVDVVNIMKQLRLEMEDKLADSDLTFRWNLPGEKVILNLDGQKTYRIFENLLSNALKYAMHGSRVYIDIVNSASEVEVVFKNISAVELNNEADRLTDRFVRGDASRTTEGSGLGLAIVKSFVELQGGSFKIDIDGDLFKAIILWKK